MATIRMQVVSTGTGLCALTQKPDKDGLTVGFGERSALLRGLDGFPPIAGFPQRARVR